MTRVIAVVPTFGPDDQLLSRLVALSQQVDAVVVVDDGSDQAADATLLRIEAAGFEVIRHSENRGIAAALNTGTKVSLARGADYVLTIDQDSRIPDGYVAGCLAAFALSAGSAKLGIVSAESISNSPTIASEHTAEGLGLLRVAIQSGFVVSRQCLEECGLFDEGLFIDFVDTEYCLRIARFGYRVAAAPGTNIEHALGERMPLRPFGIQRFKAGVALTYEYHGPVRRFYITRNGIDLYLRYLGTNPRWVLSSFRQEFRPLVTTLIAGPLRGRQFVAAFTGALCGLARQRGPIPAGLRKLLSAR